MSHFMLLNPQTQSWQKTQGDQGNMKAKLEIQTGRIEWTPHCKGRNIPRYPSVRNAQGPVRTRFYLD